MPKKRNPVQTRRSLVEAMISLILQQGYTSTTVEQVCEEAQLTKGSFFHHFRNKEATGLAAMEAWSDAGAELYDDAIKREDEDDPLAALHRLVDLMQSFALRNGQPCRCVLGMITQEMAGTHEAFREAAERYLAIWTEMVRDLLEQAKAAYVTSRDFDAEELAWFFNSLWQGSMLVAKAKDDQDLIVRNLAIARSYLAVLFPESQVVSVSPPTQENPMSLDVHLL